MTATEPVAETPMADPYRVPPGTVTFGVTIAMVSTIMVFGAGMSAYLVMAQRYHLAVAMPRVLWFSTFVILCSSAVLHYALLSAWAGHAVPMRRAAGVAAVLGALFLLLQAPGLMQLAHNHAALGRQNVLHYGTAMVLIGLHAAHVIGGLAPLSVIARRIWRMPADAYAAETLNAMGLFWHLLSVVWVCMFTMFLIAG